MFLCSVRAPFGGKMGSAITPAPMGRGLANTFKKTASLSGPFRSTINSKKRFLKPQARIPIPL